MAQFMIQVAYTPEAMAKLVKQPDDRVEAVRPAVEKLGGCIENAYFEFGDYDLMMIAQLPDNASAAAISLAFLAGGALRACKTTVLMSIPEGLEAMRKAGTTGYRPPNG